MREHYARIFNELEQIVRTFLGPTSLEKLKIQFQSILQRNDFDEFIKRFNQNYARNWYAETNSMYISSPYLVAVLKNYKLAV